MRKLLLASAAAFVLSFGYGVSTTSAAPAGPASIAAPDSGIEQARMHRKRMKRGRSTRATQRSVGGNMEQPARGGQTGKGGAGGGGGGGSQ